MPKTPAEAAHSPLRAIPSVERILSSEKFAPHIAEFGREQVKAAVNQHLADLRAARQPYDESGAVDAVGEALSAAIASTLRRVVNASGIIIHTNLGRSPIDPAVWNEAADLVTGWSNLEFDLERGERGKRDEHLTALCRSLFG
ncbi:MAG TPA: L-seryl-tRNA(Sec) selenium transferase, partial [Thermoanaerobaculia bacterium]